jgi:hypothetical protein
VLLLSLYCQLSRMPPKKTYKKTKGKPNDELPTQISGVSLLRQPSPSRVNRAFVELESRPRPRESGHFIPQRTTISNGLPGERVGLPRSAKRLDASKLSAPVDLSRAPPATVSNRLPGERVGPPRGAKRLDASKPPETADSSPIHAPSTHVPPPAPSSHVPSSRAPSPAPSSHAPSIRAPSPARSTHAQSTRAPSIRASSPMPLPSTPDVLTGQLSPTSPTTIRPFPLDDSHDLSEDGDSGTMNRSKQPLFLPDEDSEMGDAFQYEHGDGDDLFGDQGEQDEQDEGAISDQDEDPVEDEDADEELVASMMTGGRFTREQILEVQDLTKSLMIGLRQRAKKWKRPLDSVMRIANLIITTKERRVSGNVWNAFQSKYPEDPKKETREYSFWPLFLSPRT